MTMNSDNTFKQAVEAIAPLASHYQVGLQAMERKYQHLLMPENTRRLEGSVDIDSAKKESDPNGARWDYAIGYNGIVYYIEIHPANTSNVGEMIAKSRWLNNWLNVEGLPLKQYHEPEVFYWIPTGKVAITKNSTYFKKLALCKLKLSATPLKMT